MPNNVERSSTKTEEPRKKLLFFSDTQDRIVLNRIVLIEIIVSFILLVLIFSFTIHLDPEVKVEKKIGPVMKTMNQ